MKAKYVGKTEYVIIERDKLYDIISIEHGLYRVQITPDMDYLFDPSAFEIVEN